MSVYKFFDIIRESESAPSAKSFSKHITAALDDFKSVRFWINRAKRDALVIEQHSNIADQLLPKKIEKIVKMIDELEHELNIINDFVEKSVK